MNPLLSDIEHFLAATGRSSYRFGLLAARNGRLVDRLRSGRRVWPETEKKIRDFMARELTLRACQSASADPAKVSDALPVSLHDAEALPCPETEFPNQGRKIA